jgi:uncharacterized protein YjbJ (UPF0337 family)
MTEKLELLEEKVRDTLEETRSTVEDIVGNVKETVGETVEVVKGTVDEAKSTVENIVVNVKETMDDTVTMVRHSFDLPYQVEQRPWLMLGGSVVVGWMLGNMFRGPARRSYASYDYDEYDNAKESYLRKTGGLTSMYTINNQADESGTSGYQSEEHPSSSSTHSVSRGRWLPSLPNFQQEIDMLKGAAIGTLMGTLREMIRQNMPSVAPHLEKVINSASAKLGAEPIDPSPGQRPNGHEQKQQTTSTPTSSYSAQPTHVPTGL